MSLNNPIASPRIVFREEEDAGLLFDPDSGLVKVLNETGKFIWQNLDGKNSKDDLIKKVRDTFNVDEAQKIKDDLDKFLEDLKAMKFLEA